MRQLVVPASVLHHYGLSRHYSGDPQFGVPITCNNYIRNSGPRSHTTEVSAYFAINIKIVSHLYGFVELNPKYLEHVDLLFNCGSTNRSVFA